MAAWFALAAPYLPEIIKLAVPLFTRGTKAADKRYSVLSSVDVDLVMVEQCTRAGGASMRAGDNVMCI